MKKAIMSIGRSTGLLFLFVSSSILISAEGAENCEIELIQGCISNYKGILRGTPSPDKHCSRVQDVVSCFAKNPSCKEPSINRFRLWILQEAMLEAKLKICPEVNYKSLKDSVENTDVAKEHTLVENFGLGDSLDPCAAEVHTMCSQTFLDLMKQDQRICGDSAQWFACYSKTKEYKRVRTATRRLSTITLLLSKRLEFNLSVMPCLRIHVTSQCKGCYCCLPNTCWTNNVILK